MSLQLIDAASATANLERYDRVIDVRSPSEYAEDHLPGAVNWPVLDDEQRRIVGTMYKQASPFEARQVGAAMVARNIADHVERWVRGAPREWQPLVYCWRGGQRSGSMAWFLGQIGFRTHQLGGGYKAFRAIVRQDLETRPGQHAWRVLAGRTGSGKTRLLQALAAEGAQVLDLEGLACHRGSVLGALPGSPQPSQKRFDTLVWHTLGGLDPSRPVWVESESRKIGQLRVPEALIAQMHEHGRCVSLQMPDEARLALLLDDYGHFAADAEAFCRLLDALVEARGRDTVRAWQAMARAGEWRALFAELMAQHYDPLYERSMHRHYAQLGTAPTVAVADGSDAAMHAAARALIAAEPAHESAAAAEPAT